MKDYARKRDAAGLIMKFMGYLARHHNALQMHYLWASMDSMMQRYGPVFVADSIKKDPDSAVMALWTYGQGRRAT